MQSTGQTSTHDLSLMSMQGSAMMYVTVSESSEAPERPTPEPTPERPGHSFLTRVAAAIVIVALIALALLTAAAFLPRWWAHRIGDQVGGSIASGIGLGLFYGFVFTFLALVALWLVFRRRRGARAYVIGAAVAIVLASPNLLTLGIVLGSGNAAHAGDRTLDVEAPSFRTSALIGAIAAAVAVLGVVWLLRSRRRGRERERTLRDELAAARAAQVSSDDESAAPAR
jgi:MFS family permease